MFDPSIGQTPLLIFAGGQGSRMREETEFRPKPMVLVGGQPMILRIMKWYSKFGVNNFVILLGYKGDYIVKYFTETFDNVYLETSNYIIHHIIITFPDVVWKITLIDTGLETSTAGRLLQATQYLNCEYFFCTYGDAISDVDVSKQLQFFKQSHLPYLVSVAQQRSRFGEVQFDPKSKIMFEFIEKPVLKNMVNIGHFILSTEINYYLRPEEMFEESVMPNLAKEGNCIVYEHEGFWKSIDTLRDLNEMNEILKSKTNSWDLE